MPDIKLAQLPDRTPIKITITVLPDQHRSLLDYAAVYEATYGRKEEVADLIPAMLKAFIEGDRDFARRGK
ncbi:DUF2274 domain-containing protein [Sphingomonas sp. AAP5]|uniref:DUF2274 domain-containing protein n=1 Tax=unclassified Sphingomonas TaxID=196159 RepID=UPI0010570603|nr:DUF2274 domain-containing protein [Sphingomonas sp. AAP5]QBM75929.1 DUF2274 domain-containing protein [Sphingomonas sp. AAP5]